jgi:hypothetical protein
MKKPEVGISWHYPFKGLTPYCRYSSTVSKIVRSLFLVLVSGPILSFLLDAAHRLNIFKVYLVSCVQRYSLAKTPQLPPLPAFGLIYEAAIGQPR